MESGSAEWAMQLAADKLAGDLPVRWRHVEGTIRRGEEIAMRLGDRDTLVAAAALHDVGLAPDVVDTHASMLDGARWLQRAGAPTRLVDLVAHCDCGQIEAALRGHEEQYKEFEDERSPTRDALWYCCLTTGADGRPVTVEERMAAWGTSYAGDEVIGRYAELARDELVAAVERTLERLGATTARQEKA